MTPGREFYIWHAQSFTARIDLNLVDNLNRTLADPRLKNDEELGGILLGRALGPDAVEITDFELMPSQHHRGAIYSLGLREQLNFTKRVAGLRRKSSHKPVGFFRTHIRRGLFLDQDDLSLMSEAFAGAPNVAMLIRPIEPGPANAGIFLWEDGDIDRRQSPLVFPFDADTLRAQGPIESTVPAAEPIPEPIARPTREPFRVPAIPARWIVWGATAGVGALALSAALPHIHVKPQQPQAVVLPVNTPIEAVKNTPAQPAAEPQQVAVAEPEPVTVESPQPDESKPDQPRLDQPKPDEGGPTEAAPRAYVRTAVPQVRIAAPKRLAAVAPPPIVMPRPDEAVPLTIPAESLPAPAPRPKPVRREPSVQVAVSFETKESSELKRVVSHVPLFGRTVHAEGGSGFVPARPNGSLEPRVPGALAGNLSGDFAVDVRLSIDKHGSVTNAQVLNGAGTDFASLAVNNAGTASWEPAHEGDRRVPSDVIVHYRFSPGTTPTSGAQQ